MSGSSLGKGIGNAVLAYTLWGILPLYWKLLSFVQPLHILAFRILMSLVSVSLLLWILKNTAWFRLFKEKGKRNLAIWAALLVTFNWGLYIWAVNSGRTIEAALGYYINPLISILLGLIFFKERLLPMQWAAFAAAAAGVVFITLSSGGIPWISLGLALSFGFYALVKKKIPVSSLESLAAETLAAMPVGIVLLVFPLHNLSDLSGLGFLPWAGLLLSGIITAVPLYCFAQGAKYLSLSALGFIQFLTPTLQFLIGRFVFGEPFPRAELIAFGFIWSSVILYVISLVKKRAEP
ncbi:MAG: EamA family transporter RarD [Treponema sp.]|jgi:chloramphenicol-sensitive protein RarD|nr:EamA family transporter RarD [Treponema sp.]